MNNTAASQTPGALKQATVWGTSRRGQLEAGGVSLYWPHRTHGELNTEIYIVLSESVHAGVSSALCDVLVRVWGDFCFKGFVFLNAVGLHLLVVFLKVLTASIFLSWALEVKGTYQAEDIYTFPFPWSITAAVQPQCLSQWSCHPSCSHW